MATATGRMIECEEDQRLWGGYWMHKTSSQDLLRENPVWVLHGFGATKIWVRPLELRLRELGWKASSYGYQAFVGSIETRAARLIDIVRSKFQQTRKPLYLVGHSMGGIVARIAAESLGPEVISKLVLICSPNLGSHVATKVERFVGPLFPMVAQMSDRSDSFVRNLPPPKVPCAIIAASNDFVVRPENTKIAGVEQWMMVPGMHSAAPWRKDVAEAVDRFLRTGCLTA